MLAQIGNLFATLRTCVAGLEVDVLDVAVVVGLLISLVVTIFAGKPGAWSDSLTRHSLTSACWKTSAPQQLHSHKAEEVPLTCMIKHLDV